MLRVFCDICTEPCQKATGTRRFEDLASTHDALPLGLETILLCAGTPAGDRHVCDRCLLDLIWKMAEVSPGTGLAQRQQQLVQREKAAEILRTKLDKAIEQLGRFTLELGTPRESR